MNNINLDELAAGMSAAQFNRLAQIRKELTADELVKLRVSLWNMSKTRSPEEIDRDTELALREILAQEPEGVLHPRLRAVLPEAGLKAAVDKLVGTKEIDKSERGTSSHLKLRNSGETAETIPAEVNAG